MLLHRYKPLRDWCHTHQSDEWLGQMRRLNMQDMDIKILDLKMLDTKIEGMKQ